MFTVLAGVGFQMVPWAFFTVVKKTTNIHAYIFGGGRVPDGTLSLFDSTKKNDKIHVYIFGGGRVPDAYGYVFHRFK